jgi:hypothetical protein
MNNEQTIANLEAKIQELKDEVQNLKQPANSNAFIKKYNEINPEKLKSFSEEAFGDMYALQIAHGACTCNHKDLRGRSFFVYDNYKAILHEAMFGGMIIEIQKKYL